MGKKKTGAMPTSAPKQKKKMVIDMNKVELAKVYQAPGFRTGSGNMKKKKDRGDFLAAAAKAAAAMIEPVLFL